MWACCPLWKRLARLQDSWQMHDYCRVYSRVLARTRAPTSPYCSTVASSIGIVHRDLWLRLSGQCLRCAMVRGRSVNAQLSIAYDFLHAMQHTALVGDRRHTWYVFLCRGGWGECDSCTDLQLGQGRCVRAVGGLSRFPSYGDTHQQWDTIEDTISFRSSFSSSYMLRSQTACGVEFIVPCAEMCREYCVTKRSGACIESQRCSCEHVSTTYMHVITTDGAIRPCSSQGQTCWHSRHASRATRSPAPQQLLKMVS